MLAQPVSREVNPFELQHRAYLHFLPKCVPFPFLLSPFSFSGLVNHLNRWRRRLDSNQRISDLQSDPLGHLGTPPIIITQEVSSEAKVIFGAIQDEKLSKGEIKVTVIATGF